MVNWNSRFATIGHQFDVTLEVVEVRTENDRLVTMVKVVNVPEGATAQTFAISGVPGDDDDDDDKDSKKSRRK